MRLFVLLLALLLPVLVSAADAIDPELTAIAARLARPAVVRGDFVQTKQIAGLTRPLVARGSFVVARGTGVLWDTREPFAQQLRISARGVDTALEDGSRAFVGGTAPGPALREVNRVLSALFEADLAVLQRYFRVRAEQGEATWRIALVPRVAALGEVFAAIDLRGDVLLQGIDLQEANGDRTTIVFEHAAAGDALSDGERRALDR